MRRSFLFSLSLLLDFRISVGQMLLKSLISVWYQSFWSHVGRLCVGRPKDWTPILSLCSSTFALVIAYEVDDEHPAWCIVHFVMIAVNRKFLKLCRAAHFCTQQSADCGVMQTELAQGNSKVISLDWLHWTSGTCILMPCSASFFVQILYALCKRAVHVLCKISCWQNSFAIRKYCIAWAEQC